MARKFIFKNVLWLEYRFHLLTMGESITSQKTTFFRFRGENAQYLKRWINSWMKKLCEI